MRHALGENRRMEVEQVRDGVWMYFIDGFSVCIQSEQPDGDYSLEVCQMPPLDYVQTCGVIACLAFAASRMIGRAVGVDTVERLECME